MRLKVYRAADAPASELLITEEVPKQPLDAQHKDFDQQARGITNLLVRCLPAGVLDRLVGHLMLRTARSVVHPHQPAPVKPKILSDLHRCGECHAVITEGVIAENSPRFRRDWKWDKVLDKWVHTPCLKEERTPDA